MLTLAGAAMTLVHGWGWLLGIQPPRENAETVLYAVFTVGNWLVAATI